MDHHAFDRLVELEVITQRGILEGLQLVVHCGLAIVVAVGDVLEEQVDFLVRNDVADALGVPTCELAECQTDHLVAGDRRSAAVSRIDRRIHLDAQSRYRKVVRHEFDPRHDSFGDRERRASGREAVGQHGILDLRQLARALDRRMGVEEARIVELQNGEVDAGSDGDHVRRHLVAGGIGLDLHLGRVEHDVRIGQDAPAVDHDAGGGDIGGALLGPRLERVGIAHRGEHLHHRTLRWPARVRRDVHWRPTLPWWIR